MSESQGPYNLGMDEIVEHETNFTEANKIARLHQRVSLTTKITLLEQRGRKRRNRSLQVINLRKLNNKLDFCPCCGMFPRDPLLINFSKADLGFLGPGYTLYFTLQQLCILLLFFFFILVSTSKQTYLYVAKHAGKKFLSSIVDQTDLLCLNVFIVTTLLISFYSRMMVNIEVEADQLNTGPEDYSVHVKNIPILYDDESEDFRVDKELANYFQKFFSTNLKVAQVCLYYNLVPLNILTRIKEDTIEKMKQSYARKGSNFTKKLMVLFNDTEDLKILNMYTGVSPKIEANNQKTVMRRKDEIDGIKESICRLNTAIDNGYSNNKQTKLLFLGQAIVSFEHQSMAEYLLDEDLNLTAMFYGNQLQFSKPEHPKGIYWHNLHLNDEDYRIRNTFSFISCSAIFLCSLFIQMLLNYLKFHFEDTDKQFSKIFGFFSSITINIINIVIPMFALRVFSSFQGHRTRTDELMSIVRKSLILQVMNTLLVPILVIFMFEKPYASFLETKHSVMFRNALFSVLQLTFSGKMIWKQVQFQMFKRGYAIKKVAEREKTIRQLCELLEYPPFEIEVRSSEILKTMVLTFFLGYEIKKIILYALISSFFNYWIDKYNLARKRTAKYHVNATLNIYMMTVLQTTVPFFIACQLFFHNRSVAKWILLIVSLVGLLKPIIRMFKAGREKDEYGKNLKYSQCKMRVFETNYRRENPALRGQQTRELIDRQDNEKNQSMTASVR